MNYKDVLKKFEPFLVLGVFLLLLFNAFTFYKSLEVQKQVAETTGWEDEKVRCFCAMKDVLKWEDEREGMDENFNVPQNISWSLE